MCSLKHSIQMSHLLKHFRHCKIIKPKQKLGDSSFVLAQLTLCVPFDEASSFII